MYQNSEGNRYWVSEKSNKPSVLAQYRQYRKFGLKPVNAYSALLSISVSANEKYRRLQRVADWMNKEIRTG